MLGAAEGLCVDLDTVGQRGEVVSVRGGDQNHVRIQALGQLLVDLAGVVALPGGDHAFYHHNIGVLGGLLIAADDFFQYLVQLAHGELVLNLGERH